VDQDVDKLDSFLRGEMSAVETYDQALEKLGDDPTYAAPLRAARESHRKRVELLRDELLRRGAMPSEGSGIWGGFAKLVEGGAKLFGAKSAIAALEEGEDHGRDDYRRELEELTPEARSFVEHRLLPEQLKTHDAISSLKHSLP
jgi:demethoxyubiquinone hydroxylase (CLK1/Coq7/Cat5 family)